MKIVCVARNYALHAQEMGTPPPQRPVFFLKPSTAWAASGEIPYPSFSERLEYEVELVFRLSRGGRPRCVEEALSFCDAITVGIDFTARDLQAQLKAQGLPWEMAKAFDGSAWWGAWLPIPPDWPSRPFRLYRGSHLLQEGRGQDMLFPLPQLLMEAGRYFSWEPGDVLFTGTPPGVGPVAPGDALQVYFDQLCLGEVWIVSSRF